jgi:hypothetical protein
MFQHSRIFMGLSFRCLYIWIGQIFQDPDDSLHVLWYQSTAVKGSEGVPQTKSREDAPFPGR